MHDTEKKVEKIAELKSKLVCGFEAYLGSGFENINAGEAGEVTDMIKDLAEAEEKCWKACYYKKIVEAMEEAKKNPEMMQMLPMMMEEEDLPWYMEGLRGYDRYRYKSSGRYAPKGHGTKMPVSGRHGYVPPQPWDDLDGRMPDDSDPRFGKPYNMFKDARRHYTETHSPSDKTAMSEHAMEHMQDTFETVRDIWQDADPDLRKRMKSDMGKLMNELSV